MSISNTNYSIICDHLRLKRLNQNFVRCLDCGLSMISHAKIMTNKREKDFVNENKCFVKNFDRNFSNILEEEDNTINKPLYEYYMDRRGMNRIIVNKQVKFHSNPPKYEVIVNGSKHYLVENDIKKILTDINAIRVDKQIFIKKDY